MQVVGENVHNYLPFTVILSSILGLIHIWLTWKVIKLRRKYRQAVGVLENEEYARRNGALNNFTSNVPIVLILFALAENNHVSCGYLFFFGSLFLLGRLMHIYSLYAYETKTKRFTLRIFAMMSTFFVILALAGANLYKIATHFSY